MSDYELSVKDGQFHLVFKGLWTETTMWELYALAIIDELKTRANLKRLSEFGLDILYARAKTQAVGEDRAVELVCLICMWQTSAPAAVIVFCGRNM